MHESTPLLQASDLTLARSGHGPSVLEDVNVSLAPGECVHVAGSTGSGKSTLLRALAGQRDIDLRSGRVVRRGEVAMLAQHVELQLLCATVGEEVRLGLDLRGWPAAEAERRGRDALSAVGLAGFEQREVDTLSAGQKQRTVLAALLALDPGILLLDEPTSALDAVARQALCRALVRLKRRGMAIVVVDHATAELEPAFDRRLVLEKGRLMPRRAAAHACKGGWPDAGVGTAARAERIQRGRVVAQLPRHPRSASTAATALPIRAGERVLVTGPNGSGKSTWLRALAALAGARSGAMGRAAMAAPGDVALVIQEPRRALFSRTVAEEVAFTPKRRGWQKERVHSRVEALLSRFELLDCADRSPLRLSFGQQHRLAIAAALAASPSLTLLDEPFAGLDTAGRHALLRILDAEQRSSGAAMVIASHDRAPLATGCDRVIELSDCEVDHG